MIEGKNILIVDDEEGVRQALIRGIRRKFHSKEQVISITEAENGLEAIELAHKSAPDLIIMDIRMPIMNGLKACRILRNDSKFAATKIIMLTCEIAEEEAGLSAGADDYVIKPFDIKTLLIRIERGLFFSSIAKNLAFVDSHGMLSKEFFLAACLTNELVRAKRYHHPLSLILVKVEPTFEGEDEDAIDRGLEIHSFIKARRSDRLIKWNKNTFAILLTETNATDATLIAHRISWQIRKSIKIVKGFFGIANLEDTFGDDLVTNAESSLKLSIRTGEIVLNRLAICE